MRSFVRSLVGLCVVLSLIACDGDDDDDNEEDFIAFLTGSAERPDPVDTDATGIARIEIDDDEDEVEFSIDVEDITAVTVAHIHGPAGPNGIAGPIVTLYNGPVTGDEDGRLVDGEFEDTEVPAISMDSLFELIRDGQAYVNVHTVANPAGEIRGQLEFADNDDDD